jgi:hypothetical protein
MRSSPPLVINHIVHVERDELAAVLVIGAIALIAVTLPLPGAATPATCVDLTPDSCAQFIELPGDFSFTEGNPYWHVVGIIPSDNDDKDIRIYTACAAGGTLLAASVGFQGADFVVGDFNQTPAGTYYARVEYGDPSFAYQYYLDGGSLSESAVLPLGEVVGRDVASAGLDCGIFRIWDVYFEAGETYLVSFTTSGPAEVRLALFRNPGSGAFWTSRYGSLWELSESANTSFAAQTTGWYGLVAFANHRSKTGNYTIRITPDGQATGVDDDPPAPERFALWQNAPNPFNPSTSIRFDVPTGGAHVRLQVFDVEGRRVRTLSDGDAPAGRQTVTWFGDDDSGDPVAGGVYFCRLSAPGFAETRKMVLLK